MSAVDLVQVARAAAQAGADVALGWHRRVAELSVEHKTGPRDLVSQADREAELAIRHVLNHRRPDDGVLGEEGGQTTGSTDVQWVLDPIDGTTSYLYGRSDWSVSVAAVSLSTARVVAAVVAEPAHDRMTEAVLGAGTRCDGKRVALRQIEDLAQALVEVNFGHLDQHPRAGPMVSALLPHVRDLRRGGSAASALTALASGRADAVWSPGLQPWDGSAGLLLVQEAGGVVGDLDGVCDATWPASGDILAASPTLWEPLQRLLKTVYRV